MTTESRIKIAFEVFIFLVMAFTLVWNLQSGWQFYSALMPLIFSTFGVIMSGLVLLRELIRFLKARKQETAAATAAAAAVGTPFLDIAPTMLRFFAWLAGFYIGVVIIGFLPAMFLAIVVYMRLFGHTNWLPAIVTSAVVVAVCYGLYEELLHIVWPEPLVLGLLP